MGEEKRLEERVLTFLEKLPNPISIVDSANKLTFVNQAFLETWGYDDENQILGRPTDEFWKVKGEALPRQSEIGELVAMKKNGSEFYVQFSASVVTDESGQPPSIMTSFIDITERKKAAEALRESEEKHKAVLAASPNAITVTDLEGRIFYVSQQTAEVHGFDSEDEILGKRALEFVAPEEHEKVLANINETLKQGIIRGKEHTFVKKDGSYFAVELSAATIKDKDNKAIGFVVITQDITERKQLELEQIRSEKLKSLGVLAGRLAHDFNNALVGIRYGIEFALQNMQEGTQTYTDLQQAEQACTHATSLANQLLTFSKGNKPITEPARIEDLVRESTSMALTGSKTKPAYQIDDGIWPVEVDREQIKQAFMNLLLNADQAMPKGGIVEVKIENIEFTKCDQSKKYVRVSITDQGVGISEAHLSKIFDPYFTTKQKGSGLGLATAYSIIRNHQGSISVESELEKRTTFYVCLPASEKQAITAEERDERELPTGKGRVLIMDDEEIVRTFYSKALTRAGFKVETAEHGEQALALYQQNPFDVVVMDLTIPGAMGGKEAVARLHEINPTAKAIVSSGYSDDPVMANFPEYGFAACIVKPTSPHDLISKVKTIIETKD